MIKKRNTVQKQIVFEAFSEMRNHPSAGMVLEAVREKYPGISQATVYRLLAEAAEEGEILRLQLHGTADRYDFTLHPHRHVVCRCCGAVADANVEWNADDIVAAAVPCEDFTIEACHLEFSGVCAACAANQNRSAIK